MQRKNKLLDFIKILIGILIIGIPISLYILFSQEEATKESSVYLGANYLILKEDLILELNKPIEIKEFVDTNYTILEYPTIDFEKIGKQEIRFLVGSENGVEEVKKEIEIIDKTSPVITLKQNELSITEGDTVVMEELFKVTDEQEYKINISEFDLTKIGRQEIKITASDLSSNQSEAVLILDIKEKPKVSVTDTKPILNNREENSSTPVVEVPNTSQNSNSSRPSLSPKYYLYKNGYNRKTGFATCMSENNIYENGGGCILYYEDGKEVGYQYQP